MPNTDCLPFCDDMRRIKTVSILGVPVPVKGYVCSPDGKCYHEKTEPIRLQLSVCPTSYCPADCPFCIAGDTKTRQTLDLTVLERVMRRLQQEDRVRGIKITGGEPFWDVGLLDDVIRLLFEVFGYGLELSVSTNGIHLDWLHRIRDLEHLETIHISRHHYDDAVNRRLFGGAQVPTGEQLKEIINSVSFRDLFVLNCMLLKDYIHTPEQAHRFLDFAIGVGAPKAAFITCAPANEFARSQYVAFEDVIRSDDPALLFTRGFFDYDFCHCRDGVYASQDGSIIEFYGRSTGMDGCAYSRGLVYGADNHLRTGFGGTVIV